MKIGADHELARYIEETIIVNDCSPAAVLGYAKMEGRTFKTSVSVATIYSYIKKMGYSCVSHRWICRGAGRKSRGTKR